MFAAGGASPGWRVTITGTTVILQTASWCLRAKNAARVETGIGTSGAATIKNQNGITKPIAFVVVHSVSSKAADPVGTCFDNVRPGFFVDAFYAGPINTLNSMTTHRGSTDGTCISAVSQTRTVVQAPPDDPTAANALCGVLTGTAAAVITMQSFGYAAASADGRTSAHPRYAGELSDYADDGQRDAKVPPPSECATWLCSGPLGRLGLSVWRIIVGTVSVEVHPATPERWKDLVTVFGRRGKDPSWDWCQLFLLTSAVGPPGSVTNRTALQQEIRDAGVPPGVIAYVDDRPVGWSRVGPRDSFPGVRGNRALARVLPDLDASVWWVTCFAVDSRHRRAGIGGALLQADVEFARDHGASAVEGHPVDVSALKATKVSGSAIYTGTVALFTAAGFVEVGRTAPTRPVMRREL